MDPLDDFSLHSSIHYLKTKYNYKQILVECGPSTTIPYYLDKVNPNANSIAISNS